jgi:hypothetical protein
MGCCGQVRSRLTASATAVRAAKPSRPAARFALYEYVGSTSMTVAAPVSGAKYRFGSPGARLQVDMRDVISLSALPNLHRVE